MSMAVDLSTPLSDQERSYLAMRGRYSEIERADGLTGSEPGDLGSGDGSGPKVFALNTGEARAARRAQLEEELRQLEEMEGGGDNDVSRTGSVEDGEVDPYETWNVKEIDAELKRRNLDVSGNKQDKVARLYADDEAATV